MTVMTMALITIMTMITVVSLVSLLIVCVKLSNTHFLTFTFDTDLPMNIVPSYELCTTLQFKKMYCTPSIEYVQLAATKIFLDFCAASGSWSGTDGSWISSFGSVVGTEGRLGIASPDSSAI